MQRIVRAVEALHLFHVGRGAQRAVEAIGPGMVGALDRGAKQGRMLLAEAAAAVPAMGVKGAGLAGSRPLRALAMTAQHDHALIAKLEHEAAARRRELRHVPGKQPRPREDPLALGKKHLRRDEVLASKGVLPPRGPLFHDHELYPTVCAIRVRRAANA